MPHHLSEVLLVSVHGCSNCLILLLQYYNDRVSILKLRDILIFCLSIMIIIITIDYNGFTIINDSVVNNDEG